MHGSHGTTGDAAAVPDRAAGPSTGRRRSVLVLVAALACSVAAGAHLQLWWEHRTASLLAASFLLAAAAQLVVAGTLADAGATGWTGRAAVGVHAGVVGAWASSRTVGLGPLMASEAIGASDVIATALAVIAVAAVIVAGRLPRAAPSMSVRRRRSLAIPAALLVAAGSATAASWDGGTSTRTGPVTRRTTVPLPPPRRRMWRGSSTGTTRLPTPSRPGRMR